MLKEEGPTTAFILSVVEGLRNRFRKKEDVVISNPLASE